MIKHIIQSIYQNILYKVYTKYLAKFNRYFHNSHLLCKITFISSVKTLISLCSAVELPNSWETLLKSSFASCCNLASSCHGSHFSMVICTFLYFFHFNLRRKRVSGIQSPGLLCLRNTTNTEHPCRSSHINLLLSR